MKFNSHIFLLVILTSCWSDKPSEERKMEKIDKRVNREIARNTEKLLLLANIQNIEFEKVETIIREYLAVT